MLGMAKCLPQPMQNTSRPASSGTNGIAASHEGHRTSSMSELVGPAPAFVYFIIKPQEGICGLTDAGNEIPLFRYEAAILQQLGAPLATQSEKYRQDLLLDQEQQFLTNTCGTQVQATKLAQPSALANCHGWIFTDGTFGVVDTEVPRILRDNGYVVVNEPRVGDLAMFSLDGEICHAAIVRKTAGAELLLESKWGPFSVYQHSLTAQPYRGPATFYRSVRNGHRVEIARARQNASASA
jgi:hypothetical protein